LRATPGVEPIVPTLGLSTAEAERQAVLGPPDGREARAISMSYEYGRSARTRDAEAIRSGIAVPLPGETAQLGLLTIFTRVDRHEVRRARSERARGTRDCEPDRRSRMRETLPRGAQLADLDALTGLHNRATSTRRSSAR
jgi:hypothetical protein